MKFFSLLFKNIFGLTKCSLQFFSTICLIIQLFSTFQPKKDTLKHTKKDTQLKPEKKIFLKS